MTSKSFVMDSNLVYMNGFGIGYFKGMLRLDVHQEIWNKWKDEFQAVGILFNKAAHSIGLILEQLWRELTFTEEQKNTDTKRVERYGDLLGTDFNLSLEVNAEVWKKMPIPTCDKLFNIFDGLHQAVYFAVYNRRCES